MDGAQVQSLLNAGVTRELWERAGRASIGGGTGRAARPTGPFQAPRCEPGSSATPETQCKRMGFWFQFAWGQLELCILTSRF